MRAPIGFFILVLSAGCILTAQEMTTQPGLPSTGAASLRVQVFGANNNFLSTKALVRLHDPRQMHEAWDTTHDRSETVFYHLSPGTYQVEVSAAGYHTGEANVEVYDQPIQYIVQVSLKADPGREIYKPDSDSDAGLSPSARKESERGLADLQNGKLKKAEKHFRKALKDSPKSAQVNYLLGVVALRLKQFHDADEFLERTVLLDPRHFRALTALGGLRLEQKDYPAAVKFLEQAIAVDPRQWRAHWLLANTKFQQELYEEAAHEAQLSIDLSSDSSPSARLLLGEALGNLGRYSEAINALGSYLERSPAVDNAASVRKMITEMQEALRNGQFPAPRPVTSLFPSLHDSTFSPVPAEWHPPGIDAVRPPVATGVSCPADEVLRRAGARVNDLVDALDRFTATETQIHEELDAFGRPFTREARRSDYVVAISQPRGRVDLQEFRSDLSGLGAFPDRISTRGLLSLAFVFHSTLQKDYRFDCEGLGEWEGQPTWLIRYQQISSRDGALQNFDIGRNSHPVPLKGRAWIQAVDFQILHIEAELSAPMPEIELQSENQIADYGPIDFPAKRLQLWLPKRTEIYLDLRGHRYRFSNHYTDFKLFSVDSNQKTNLRSSAR